MKIHKMKNTNIVVDYGDLGREFYVILEGSVDIYTVQEE